ncbi:hypothetical protein [Evansella cellulosilytica]|uniref:Uncharacterized protein n=1 Tax=Evansella cellulosilytica (strain ATCC 21833 / DSM 2522 / FERM P-1141 / JCM 9156 / N-4) TaxID=649639 RepID=E6TR94_EVAC2|nr:hypothetical protein [Evansella cellulosilytica]ADU30606.1 hypothetical protein Bcell_2347 [Evansella cellulosilytica DSM 2522]
MKSKENGKNDSYFEKIEKLYILNETKQMLEHKLASDHLLIEEINIIQEDIKKINKEIEAHTNHKETADRALNMSLLFPNTIADE